MICFVKFSLEFEKCVKYFENRDVYVYSCILLMHLAKICLFHWKGTLKSLAVLVFPHTENLRKIFWLPT